MVSAAEANRQSIVNLTASKRKQLILITGDEGKKSFFLSLVGPYLRGQKTLGDPDAHHDAHCVATEARTTLLLSLHVALWPVLWRGLASAERTIIALALLLLVLRARGHVTIMSLEARRHASGKALVHRERQGAARHTHGRVPTHKRLQKQDDENCQITCVAYIFRVQ